MDFGSLLSAIPRSVQTVSIAPQQHRAVPEGAARARPGPDTPRRRPRNWPIIADMNPFPTARSRSSRLAVPWLVLALLLSGCQTLLPDTKAQVGNTWKSYDEAAAAIERIVPYETRRADLWAAGMDPRTNPSITILSFSDVVQRFAASSAMRPEDFDKGVRECLTSGKTCSAYRVDVRSVHRERVGNFWLDSLAFRRETYVTGFSFNALVLMVDDLVVYTLYGGQPGIREHEIVRNPLGPLQSWGDQVPKVVR